MGISADSGIIVIRDKHSLERLIRSGLKVVVDGGAAGRVGGLDGALRGEAYEACRLKVVGKVMWWLLLLDAG